MQNDKAGHPIMYANLLRRLSARPATRTRRTKRHLSVETLEGRQLLFLGAPFVVDNGNFAQKSQVATATSSNGSSVVVWTEGTYDTLQNAGTEMIKGQYYNAAGGKAGPQFMIAFNTPGINNEEPAVAMDAHGDFVVSWTQESVSHVPYVLAQKYNAQSNPINGQVPVGVGTFEQHQSSVAMDANGDFVVAYTRVTNNNNPDVFAKVYYANSQLRYVENVATGPWIESNPKVAMDANGDFDVAYQIQNPSNTLVSSINVARYSSGLSALGVRQVSNSMTSVTPSIAMDNLGDAVVAWQTMVYYSTIGETESVYAARISSTGQYTGPIYVSGPNPAIQIGTLTPTTSIAVDPNGGPSGAFEVAFNSGDTAEVARVNSSDSVQVPYILSLGSDPADLDPSISAIGSNGFLAAWATFNSGPYSSNNVLGRRGTF